MRSTLSRIIYIIIIALLIINNLSAQDLSKLNPNDTIPLDPQVRHGKLANGFTYYLQRYPNPVGKIQVYFASKAGAHLQTKDQLDFAHIVEHMLYQASKHFPDGIAKHLLSQGFQRGLDYNAAVTHGGVYATMTISNSKPDLLNDCLNILEDWTAWGGLLFKPEHIETERGAVLGENIMGGTEDITVSSSVTSKMLNNPLYRGSLSSFREHLKKFPEESLTQFYKDWHRPNMQAAIIVGDVDVNQLESIIKERFSRLLNPPIFKSADSMARIWLPVPGGNNKIITEIDPTKNNIYLHLSLKRPSSSLTRKSDFKGRLLDKFIQEMFSARLKKVFPSRANAHFRSVTCAVANDKYSHAKLDELVIGGSLPPDSLNIQKSFNALMEEFERLRRYGFMSFELTDWKSRQKEAIKSQADEKSSDIGQRYIRHFLQMIAVPGAKFEIQLQEELLKQISLSDVNTALSKWTDEKYFNIIFLIPEKNRYAVPSEMEVLSWADKVKKSKIDSPRKGQYATVISKAVPWKMDKLTTVKKYKKESLNRIRATKLTFNNGVTVILKPLCNGMLSGKSNEIHFSAFSPGGSLLYQGDDYTAASNLTRILMVSGLGSMNKQQFSEFLISRKINSIAPFINDTEEGLIGSCGSSIESVETMLQAVYQYFTNPKIGNNAIEYLRASKNASIEKSNDGDCAEKFADISRPVNESKIGLSQENISGINLIRALDIYKERFSNAGDFTFVINGDFTLDQMINLVSKYLGNLPSSKNTKEKATELTYSLPKPRTIVSGDSSRAKTASVYLKYTAIGEPDIKNSIKFSLLGRLIQDVLVRRLRDELAGTYYVQANGSIGLASNCLINISFDCEPARVELLKRSAIEEINKLKLAVKDISALKEHEIRSRNNFLERCQNWLLETKKILLKSGDLNELAEYESIVNSVTAADILDLAVRYLKEENLWQMVCYK